MLGALLRWGFGNYSVSHTDGPFQRLGAFLNGLFGIAMNLTVPAVAAVRDLFVRVFFFSAHIRNGARRTPYVDIACMNCLPYINGRRTPIAS